MRLITTILLAIGCFFLQINVEAGVLRPRHFVFAIHGMGGSFTLDDIYLRETFLKNMSLTDGNAQYEFEYFQYDAQNDQHDIDYFTTKFTGYLEGYFSQPGRLRAGDKVSFVGFSQGSVISLKWLLLAEKSKSLVTRNVFSRINSVVLVAPALWGSHWANLAMFLKNKLGNYSILKWFGQKQLGGMSLNGDGVYKLFDEIHTQEGHMTLTNIFNRFKIVQVVGSMHPARYRMSSIFPKDFVESDLTMSIPRANMNHIYFIEDPAAYPKYITESDFSRSSFNIKTQVVEGLHLLPLKFFLGSWAKHYPELNYPSMLQTPSECVVKDLSDCNSPMTEAVVSNFRSSEATPSPKLYDFALDVVAVGDDPKLVIKELMVEFIAEGTIKKLYSTTVKNKLGLSEGRGSYEGTLKSGRDVIKMMVSAPGYQKRLLDVPLEATKTTFVKINLHPLNKFDSGSQGSGQHPN